MTNVIEMRHWRKKTGDYTHVFIGRLAPGPFLVFLQNDIHSSSYDNEGAICDLIGSYKLKADALVCASDVAAELSLPIRDQAPETPDYGGASHG